MNDRRRISAGFAFILAAAVTLCAAIFVTLFASSPSDAPAPGSDLLGRLGFVLFVSAGVAGVVVLHRGASKAATGNAPECSLPAGYVVTLFATLVTAWWINSQFRFEAFASGGQFGYLEWLSRVASLSLIRGPSNVWTPYPQGTQLFLILLQNVSNGLAAALSSDVWTAYAFFRLLFQLVFLLGPSTIIVLLVYRIGATFHPTAATFAATAIAFSFAPLYWSVAEIVVIDPLPVSLMVLAAWAIIRRRFAVAGLSIGLGAALKLFPILLLPVAVLVSTNRAQRLRVILSVLLPLIVLLGPIAIANWEIFASPYRWQSGRPPWESWYALLNWLGNAPHAYQASYFADITVGHDYGWVFWGITPTLLALVSPVPPAPARWEDVVSFLGTALSFAAALTANLSSPRAVIRWMLYFLAAFLFWSIGWSPQYELYVLPFILLAFDRPWVGVAAALFFEFVTFVHDPLLLPWAYFYGESSVWWMWGALVVRYVFLAWLCGYVLMTESSWLTFCRRLSWARRQFCAVATLMSRPGWASRGKTETGLSIPGGER